MKRTLLIIVIVLGGLYLIAGYFLGNVPVASKLLGTDKPIDLGVELSVDEAYGGLDALGHPTSIEELQEIAGNPESYGTVKTSLSEEEASSLMAINQAPDFPARHTQMKFYNDGSMETSGMIWINKLPDFLARNGVSSEGISKVMEYVGFMDSANYYMKGKFSITNNYVTMDVDTFKIGRITIPSGVINDNKGYVENTVSDIIVNNGYTIRSLTISDGKVNVDMDQPLGSIVPWLNMVHY